LIRKLRRKFVIVIMSVVAALMAATFLGVLITTSGNLERESRFTLNAALLKIDGPELHGGMPEYRPMPIITVATDDTGTVTEFKNQIFSFSDGDIQTIARQALARGTVSGVLGSYSLRFMLEKDAGGGSRLTFIDNTMETRIIANLLRNSAIIGASTLLLFFAVSVLLARWVVKPVERAWNSQRQFIADASHELRTPLTVILSGSAMLLSDGAEADDKTKTRLGNILAEAKRMKILIDDLLSLARSDGAKSSRRFEKLDFSAALLSAALRFEPVIFDLGKTFDYEVAPQLYVMGDADMLRQLFEILLDNACRHSTPGGAVSLCARSPSKNEVCLEVANESETIPKEELGRIFQRFYRLDKARSGGGYGLGLSIASSLVGELGGRLRAESENGRTVFILTLPAAK
jgi:signal transduction histidine kinase